jgi:hypothetical protein
MIQANELRLGNWVSNGDFNYTVDINSLLDAATLEYYPLEPIPLTSDILSKIGFIHGQGSFNEWWEIGSFIIFNNDFKNKSEKTFEENFYDIDIKYLHQLQNLYYALTQTELIIKNI